MNYYIKPNEAEVRARKAKSGPRLIVGPKGGVKLKKS